jgi:hypothetical protein
MRHLGNAPSPASHRLDPRTDIKDLTLHPSLIFKWPVQICSAWRQKKSFITGRSKTKQGHNVTDLRYQEEATALRNFFPGPA